MFAKKYILFKRIQKKVVIFIKSKAFLIKRRRPAPADAHGALKRPGRQLRSRTVLRPGEQSPCSLGQLPARSGPQVELYGVAEPTRPPDRRRGCPNPIRHTARLVRGEQCDLSGDIRCNTRRQRSFLRLYRYVCPGNRAAVAAWRTPPGRSAERDIRIALSSVKGNRKKAVAIRASAFWLSEIYSS